MATKEPEGTSAAEARSPIADAWEALTIAYAALVAMDLTGSREGTLAALRVVDRAAVDFENAVREDVEGRSQ